MKSSSLPSCFFFHQLYINEPDGTDGRRVSVISPSEGSVFFFFSSCTRPRLPGGRRRERAAAKYTVQHAKKVYPREKVLGGRQTKPKPHAPRAFVARQDLDDLVKSRADSTF